MSKSIVLLLAAACLLNIANGEHQRTAMSYRSYGCFWFYWQCMSDRNWQEAILCVPIRPIVGGDCKPDYTPEQLIKECNDLVRKKKGMVKHKITWTNKTRFRCGDSDNQGNDNNFPYRGNSY